MHEQQIGIDGSGKPFWPSWKVSTTERMGSNKIDLVQSALDAAKLRTERAEQPANIDMVDTPPHDNGAEGQTPTGQMRPDHFYVDHCIITFKVNVFPMKCRRRKSKGPSELGRGPVHVSVFVITVCCHDNYNC